MKMLVSGTSERLGKQFAERSAVGDDTFQWISPDGFFQQLTTPDRDAPVGRAIWLYQPPWSEAFIGTLAESGSNAVQSLRAWEHVNRMALNARSEARIPLIYINIDRAVPRCKPPGAEAANDAAGDAKATAISSATTREDEALGWLADGTMPQLWDVFEALEAVAPPPPGGEPIFRHLYRPDEAAFAALMHAVSEGQHAAHLREEIQRLRHDLADRANELADEREKHSAAHKDLVILQGENKRLQDETAGCVNALAEEQKKHSEARTESELLLAQLHQVQEELEQYYLKNVELSKELGVRRKAAETLGKEVGQLKTELTKSGREGQTNRSQLLKIRKENESLKSSLVRLQTEFEDALAPPAVGASAVRTDGGKDPLRRAAARAKAWSRERALHARIRQSGWFDTAWYLENYPDVRAARMDPVRHYLSVGWHERRNPGPKFDTAFYLRSNPDVRREGINPLLHFLEHGTSEGRAPKPPAPARSGSARGPRIG